MFSGDLEALAEAQVKGQQLTDSSLSMLVSSRTLSFRRSSSKNHFNKQARVKTASFPINQKMFLMFNYHEIGQNIEVTKNHKSECNFS